MVKTRKVPSQEDYAKISAVQLMMSVIPKPLANAQQLLEYTVTMPMIFSVLHLLMQELTKMLSLPQTSSLLMQLATLLMVYIK
jgi:hypothetical protein